MAVGTRDPMLDVPRSRPYVARKLTTSWPTGVMFNGSPTDFLLAPHMPAIFLWVTEDGTVQGWNPGVKPTTAVIEVDNSQVPNRTTGAVYKGATIAEIDGKN